MAERTDKVKNTVPGKFYVDGNCIDCDVCRETAPINFRAGEDEGHFYVFSQPKDAEAREPAWPRRLVALVTKPGEICRFMTQAMVRSCSFHPGRTSVARTIQNWWHADCRLFD